MLAFFSSTTLNPLQTCKQLHTLAFSKQVWVTLVQHLKAGFFIDLAPGQELSDISIAELIGLAKRTVLGPRSWSSSPTLLRREVINIGPRIASVDTPHGITKLLDGGRYVLSRRGPDLTCYDVHTKRIVWEYRGQWDNTAVVLDFEAEIRGDGHSMVVALCLCILDEPTQVCV
jgi:hypothetical protein